MPKSLAPETPFGEPCPRIQLEAAPLVRVIAQIRFSTVLLVSEKNFVAPLQDSLRKRYPILEREMQQQVRLTADGAETSDPTAIWRFSDAESLWEVSLAPDFVALDTKAYGDRKDFFERFEAILSAVEQHIRPGIASRIGVRYVDRVEGEAEIQRLRDLIKPELLGVGASSLGPAKIMHTLTESQFAVGGAPTTLKTRWGLVPSGATHDPSIPPAESESWILDLDAFVSDPGVFNAKELIKEAQHLGEVVYRFFRWVVSDEFLRSYGGDV